MFLKWGIPTSPVPRRFALDTETDFNPTEGATMNRMVQVMDVDGVSEADAIVFYGWDAIPRFLDWLETTTENIIDVHVFNANFEFSYFLQFLQQRFSFYGEKTAKSQKERVTETWSVLQDPMKVYRWQIVNRNGTKIQFTDDSLRFGSYATMSEVAESIRKKRAELFINIQNESAKLETDYHRGWLNEDDKDFRKSVEYSIRDIYSQSRIAKYVCDSKMDKSLTSTSHGLKEIISRVFEDESYAYNEWYFLNEKKFANHYPPLPVDMQDTAEDSTCGGFVLGARGEHYGTHTHIDYSSSYPYEYCFGRLPWGNCRYRGTDYSVVKMLLGFGGIAYAIVEFDFVLKKGYLPLISGHEVEESSPARKSRKQSKGHFVKRLVPLTYLNELKHHYRVSNLAYHEYWVFNGEVGFLRKGVQYYYDDKTELKAEGKGSSIDYLLDKLVINGGAHGKFITKTRRWKADYSEGEKRYLEEYSPAKYLFMVGYTAMYSARTRLARDARSLIEAGYHILMCDTDSIVSDCPEEELRKILGSKKFVSETSSNIEDNLGRFEVEAFEKKTEFPVFKCWGLKMYLEMVFCDNLVDFMEYGWLKPRKYAFKGASHPDLKFLMTAPTDGTVFEMTAKQSHSGKYGKVIENVTKQYRAYDMFENENEWWDEPEPWEADLNKR